MFYYVNFTRDTTCTRYQTQDFDEQKVDPYVDPQGLCYFTNVGNFTARNCGFDHIAILTINGECIYVTIANNYRSLDSTAKKPDRQGVFVEYCTFNHIYGAWPYIPELPPPETNKDAKAANGGFCICMHSDYDSTLMEDAKNSIDPTWAPSNFDPKNQHGLIFYLNQVLITHLDNENEANFPYRSGAVSAMASSFLAQNFNNSQHDVKSVRDGYLPFSISNGFILPFMGKEDAQIFPNFAATVQYAIFTNQSASFGLFYQYSPLVFGPNQELLVRNGELAIKSVNFLHVLSATSNYFGSILSLDPFFNQTVSLSGCAFVGCSPYIGIQSISQTYLESSPQPELVKATFSVQDCWTSDSSIVASLFARNPNPKVAAATETMVRNTAKNNVHESYDFGNVNFENGDSEVVLPETIVRPFRPNETFAFTPSDTFSPLPTKHEEISQYNSNPHAVSAAVLAIIFFIFAIIIWFVEVYIRQKGLNHYVLVGLWVTSYDEDNDNLADIAGIDLPPVTGETMDFANNRGAKVPSSFTSPEHGIESSLDELSDLESNHSKETLSVSVSEIENEKLNLSDESNSPESEGSSSGSSSEQKPGDKAKSAAQTEIDTKDGETTNESYGGSSGPVASPNGEELPAETREDSYGYG